MIKAINLYNHLIGYTEEELMDLDVVIEIGRTDKDMGRSEYANEIESFPSQIRILSREE